jgi:GNAT superfamily N-acetyltransferase
MLIADLAGIDSADVAPVVAEDMPELLVLQRCCWVEVAIANETLHIPALHEDLADLHAWAATWQAWRVRHDRRLIGAVRARLVGGEIWEIGRLMVAPDWAGRGLGRWLLAYAEAQAPGEASSYALITAPASTRNISTYERAGYRITDWPANSSDFIHGVSGALFLAKPRIATELTS